MANQRNSGDPLTKGLSMVIAVGALAFGAAAAFLNSERTRRLREDLERQIGDLSSRVESTLAERRPDIEQAIERSRRVAVESLDKARGVVEQSADKASEYVQRSGTRASQAAESAADAVNETADRAQDTVEQYTPEPGTGEFSGDAGEPTRRFDDRADTNTTI